MKLRKERVLEFMRERGDDEHLPRAEAELPEVLEIPRDEGLLARFGVVADDVDDEGFSGGVSPT
jgi:hypothetical protein